MKKISIVILIILFIFLTTFMTYNLFGVGEQNEISKNIESKVSSLVTNNTMEFSEYEAGVIGNYNDVSKVAGGSYHSLLLTTEGYVYSFGNNIYGQLGDGTGGDITSNNYDRNKPVKVADNPENGFTNGTVKEISVASNYSLLLTTDGYLYSFGENGRGQLGDGTGGDRTNDDNKNKPVKVADNPESGFTNGTVKEVVAGFNHALIVTTEGYAYSFGNNIRGQLGDGTTSDRNKPVKISDNPESGFINENVEKVAAGDNHSLVLKADGNVYSFGRNNYMQLGNGTTSDSNKPVKVSDNLESGFTNGTVKEIAAGNNHSLIVTIAGNVYSFGRNNYGQLGDETGGDTTNNNNKNKPVKVANNPESGFINENVKEVAGGINNAFIITTEGYLYSFGDNDFGQLGDGTTISKNKPVKVLDNPEEGFTNGTVKEIGVGDYHVLITTTEGLVRSFGANSNGGRLGIGESSNSSKPRGGRLISLWLSGNAISHSKQQVTKYSSDANVNEVNISDVTSRIVVELKKANGEYQDITNEYKSTTNGGENKYIVGESGTPFEVGLNTEESFTIRVSDENSPIFMEYTFIVDKKPPTLSEIIENGNASVCNVINNNEYYCSSGVAFIETDLSGFYHVKKEALGLETDITSDIRNGLINELATANTEKSKVIYTLTDGAGNIATIKIILDNYNPRIELK